MRLWLLKKFAYPDGCSAPIRMTHCTRPKNSGAASGNSLHPPRNSELNSISIAEKTFSSVAPSGAPGAVCGGYAGGEPARRIARIAMYHKLEDELSQTATVEVKVDVPESPAARWCVEQYYRELAERFDAGFDPVKSNPAPDADLVRQ